MRNLVWTVTRVVSDAAMVGEEVVWARSALVHLVLPRPPPPSLGLPVLAALHAAAPPTLAREEWGELVTSRLNISRALALLYFDMAEHQFGSTEEGNVQRSHLLLLLLLQLSSTHRRPPLAGAKVSEEESYLSWLAGAVGGLGEVWGEGSAEHRAVLDLLLGVAGGGRSSFATEGVGSLGKVVVGDNLGTAAAIRQGNKLSWELGGEAGRAKLAFIAPGEAKSPDPGTLVISQLLRHALARRGGALSGARVVVHRCRAARLLLLAPLAEVTVAKCSHSSLLLGPTHHLRLNGCRHLTLTAAAGRVTLTDCHHCTLHLLTPRHPLLSSSSHITLAPLSSTYSSMEQHLITMGLPVSPNLWHSPLILGPRGEVAEQGGSFSLMPPSSYDTVMVAVVGEDGGEVPGVPEEYRVVAAERGRKVVEWEEMVAALSPSLKAELKTRVEARLAAWRARPHLHNSTKDL